MEGLRKKLEAYGQQHVLRFWDDLSESQQQAFAHELGQLNLDEIRQLVDTLVLGKATAAGVQLEGLQPSPYLTHPAHGGDAKKWSEAEALGVQALRAGRVAAFTVAGGQGTRLGFDAPKGTFPVTSIRKASLFQVFAEKIRFAEIEYQTTIPWVLMTSRINNQATQDFFQQHNYFGLKKDQVFFAVQGMMAAVDHQGRLILADKGELALNPDGHGGAFRCLHQSGALEFLRQRGVEVISYFQVDNPLVQCIDPAFIGLHLQSGSEMSSKTIEKAYPEEKLGHFCLRGKQLEVIEYSDMPDSMARMTREDGKLLYGAGSIAIHVLNLSFATLIGEEKNASYSLPYHRADKKIPYVDEQGNAVIPSQNNGIKFERFLFDALPFASKPLVVETLREEDFSPVKNATGLDSPESCRRDLSRQAARWLQQAGVNVLVNEEGDPAHSIEISPLIAANPIQLKRWLTQKQAKLDFSKPLLLA
jgi:UDP-N-acetylglucosamine/UDP-N-acetylgalactosamine diphosphorylase